MMYLLLIKYEKYVNYGKKVFQSSSLHQLFKANLWEQACVVKSAISLMENKTAGDLLQVYKDSALI